MPERYEIQTITRRLASRDFPDRKEYRITDTEGDDRVATCYLEDNARLVTLALNRLHESREQDHLDACADMQERADQSPLC